MSPEAGKTTRPAIRREPNIHPFFESVRYPWHRAEAVELHRALFQAIADPRKIDLLYRQAGANLPPLPVTLAADLVWKDALEALATAGYMKRFCELLLNDATLGSVHRYARAVVEAERLKLEASEHQVGGSGFVEPIDARDAEPRQMRPADTPLDRGAEPPHDPPASGGASLGSCPHSGND